MCIRDSPRMVYTFRTHPVCAPAHNVLYTIQLHKIQFISQPDKGVFRMCERGAPPTKKTPVVGGAGHAAPLYHQRMSVHLGPILCAPLHTIQLHKIISQPNRGVFRMCKWGARGSPEAEAFLLIKICTFWKKKNSKMAKIPSLQIRVG